MSYAKLISMLGSDNDGEALNALRALGRVLKDDGRDFHWLADIVVSSRKMSREDLVAKLRETIWDEARDEIHAQESGNFNWRYHCVKGAKPQAEGQVNWLFDSEPYITSDDLLNRRDRALIRRMRTTGQWRYSRSRDEFIARVFPRCWAARHEWDSAEYREVILAHEAADDARRKAKADARKNNSSNQTAKGNSIAV